MDQPSKASKRADPAEPRHDRLLAVMLEGVLDLEMAAARAALERSSAPPRLVDRALSLLRQESATPGFVNSPLEPHRHPAHDYLQNVSGSRED